MGFAVLLLFGFWRFRLQRKSPWPERLAVIFLPVLLGALAVIYYETLLLNTRWTWSACRLAPTIGLFHGYPLFSPVDHGPINGWIYGPVAAVLWMPAALASSPQPALAIAAGINLLLLLTPLWFAARLAATGQRLNGWLAFVAGAAALLQIYPTWYMASALNVDAIAVGLGAGSCLLLLHNPSSSRNLWIAALLSALAVWTKQTEAPLILAQLAWLVIKSGRPIAQRFAVLYGVMMFAAAALTFSVWGMPTVIFNMWSVPSAHAMPGGWVAARNELTELIGYTPLLWIPCAAAAFWQIRRRFGAPDAADTVSLPPWLMAVAALVLLPLGIMATIKVGGDRNSLHSVYYLLVAAIMVLGSGSFAPARVPAWLRPGVVLLAALSLTFLAVRQVAGYATLTMLPPRCLSQEAWSFAREHPHEVYFPWDPLATLMAEDRMYHFEYGVIDRIQAGKSPDPARMTRDLPEHPTLVIYPKANYDQTMLRLYLPGYALTRTTEDWLIYRSNRGGPP